ncbi:hypothetical protein Q8A73_011392 [Channa argus]|nr:hypothetical protein Q8A73_011392 [Channa argus]
MTSMMLLPLQPQREGDRMRRKTQRENERQMEKTLQGRTLIRLTKRIANLTRLPTLGERDRPKAARASSAFCGIRDSKNQVTKTSPPPRTGNVSQMNEGERAEGPFSKPAPPPVPPPPPASCQSSSGLRAGLSRHGKA